MHSAPSSAKFKRHPQHPPGSSAVRFNIGVQLLNDLDFCRLLPLLVSVIPLAQMAPKLSLDLGGSSVSSVFLTRLEFLPHPIYLLHFLLEFASAILLHRLNLLLARKEGAVFFLVFGNWEAVVVLYDRGFVTLDGHRGSEVIPTRLLLWLQRGGKGF